MSDPDAYCVYCGQQCACQAMRDAMEQLKTANNRLKLAVEHCVKVNDFEAHNDGKMKDCPLCEAFTALKSREAR